MEHVQLIGKLALLMLNQSSMLR